MVATSNSAIVRSTTSQRVYVYLLYTTLALTNMQEQIVFSDDKAERAMASMRAMAVFLYHIEMGYKEQNAKIVAMV